MFSVHPPDLRGPAVFTCAQSGCPLCLERLLCHHEALVHAVVRRQWCGDAIYADLLQEGRIALWQAILHFDPYRGIAFSTYAWTAIQRRLWRVVAYTQRPQGKLPLTPSPDPATHAEAAWLHAAIQPPLQDALAQLPQRLRQILIAAYGLDGMPPRTLAALGRQYGVSRERVRQWRNEALVLLRLPALSGRLRRLCDQEHRQAYVQAQALNRAWLRQRRGGRP